MASAVYPSGLIKSRGESLALSTTIASLGAVQPRDGLSAPRQHENQGHRVL
jgi:hypothetical protein